MFLNFCFSSLMFLFLYNVTLWKLIQTYPVCTSKLAILPASKNDNCTTFLTWFVILVCLCKKVTVTIGSKTAISDLFCFFWYNVVLWVSNHLFEKNLSFRQVYHVLINDIEIWIRRKKSCYSKEHIPVLYMFIDCISTRSAPRLLSIKADRWVVNFLSFVSEALFERLHNWFFIFF